MVQIQINLSRSILYLWLTLSLTNSDKPLVGAQESGESKESREEMLHLNSVAPVLMEIIDLVLSLFFPPNSRQRAVVFRMGAMLLLHTIYNTIWYIYIYMYIFYHYDTSLCQNNKLLASWAFTQLFIDAIQDCSEIIHVSNEKNPGCLGYIA